MMARQRSWRAVASQVRESARGLAGNEVHCIWTINMSKQRSPIAIVVPGSFGIATGLSSYAVYKRECSVKHELGSQSSA